MVVLTRSQTKIILQKQLEDQQKIDDLNLKYDMEDFLKLYNKLYIVYDLKKGEAIGLFNNLNVIKSFMSEEWYNKLIENNFKMGPYFPFFKLIKCNIKYDKYWRSYKYMDLYLDRYKNLSKKKNDNYIKVPMDKHYI